MGTPLAITLILLAYIVHGSGQASPVAPNVSGEYLEPHNKARSDVGVGPLKWSDTLAKSASLTVRLQRDRQGCAFANLTGSKFGGNQAQASGGPMPPRAAVELWVAEKAFYVYANNSCVDGHGCGVYTQVVWRKSAELGCAQARCKDQTSLTVCMYNPPGNIVGEKPY